MAIICPRCISMNVKQVTRRMKIKYGRVERRFRCEIAATLGRNKGAIGKHLQAKAPKVS